MNMKIVLKSGTNVIEIPTGAFRATIALAEAMLPYTSDGNFWLKLESDIEKAPEPEKSEEQGSGATTQVKDTTQELEPQEIVPVEEVAKSEPQGKDKYDLGKMCSLIQLGPDKGWTAKKISEEIGCPLSSVYYYQNKILKGWWPE